MEIIKFKYEGNEGREDRGRITLGDRVVSCTYPVPYDMCSKSLVEVERLEADIVASGNTYHIEDLPDGTLLRLSYIECEWLLSTNGKIDAREAYWMNNISFYDQFWSCVPNVDLGLLNTSYIYLFIMCHPMNVIVINHSVGVLYHVATYDIENSVELDIWNGDVGVVSGIPRPCIYDMSLSDIHLQIESQIDQVGPVQRAGYMVVCRQSSGKVLRYRYEFNDYRRARQLRGNSNNISYHILDLMINNKVLLDEFLLYYPIYVSQYNLLVKRLQSLIGYIYSLYGIRYKCGVYYRVLPCFHTFLKELHEKVYISSLRSMGKSVQLCDIEDYVYHQPTARVLYLLNRYVKGKN